MRNSHSVPAFFHLLRMCHLISMNKKNALVLIMLVLLTLKAGFSDVPRVKLAENLVNTSQEYDQINPDIASDQETGAYMVVWVDKDAVKVYYRDH